MRLNLLYMPSMCLLCSTLVVWQAFQSAFGCCLDMSDAEQAEPAFSAPWLSPSAAAQAVC